MMAAETGAAAASETPLENPNSRIVIVGQILCVLVPIQLLAIADFRFAPLCGLKSDIARRS
jgi:hypothetical protein